MLGPDSAAGDSDYAQVALRFANNLAGRDYAQAYALTSTEYRQQTSLEQMQAAFEAIVPNDWGSTQPIVVERTMTNWKGKRPSDLGWVYISIAGDVYSEAITVIVALEGQEARIRQVEFGRP